MKTIVDPPSGWMYGFPKEFTFQSNTKNTRAYEGELHEWFLEQGYPQKLIDQGMLNHCRYWME